MIAAGWFLKEALADRFALVVDPVYGAPATANAGAIVVATYAFVFQVFYDFLGYTLIARGSALCLGFSLSENFRRPFFARNPVEYWQRWHISLTSWVRDYLFLPLLGTFRHRMTPEVAANTAQLIAILVIGVWHGANWTFALFGVVWAGAIIGYRYATSLLNRWRKQHPGWRLISWWLNRGNRFANVLKTLMTLHIAVFAASIFRAESLTDWVTMGRQLFDSATYGHGLAIGGGRVSLAAALIGTVVAEFVQVMIERKKLNFEFDELRVGLWRGALGATVVATFLLGLFADRGFIYFEF